MDVEAGVKMQVEMQEEMAEENKILEEDMDGGDERQNLEVEEGD